MQSVSEWAPLCIGPYCQANTVLDAVIFVAGSFSSFFAVICCLKLLLLFFRPDSTGSRHYDSPGSRLPFLNKQRGCCSDDTAFSLARSARPGLSTCESRIGGAVLIASECVELHRVRQHLRSNNGRGQRRTSGFIRGDQTPGAAIVADQLKLHGG